MKKNEIGKQNTITRSFYSRFVKRFFDFTISLIGIIVLTVTLILPVTYLLTLIFLGGPAIYKQVRPGKNHKSFFIYKFRTMTNKKDENGNLLPDEQRITKFGKFLRKTSLDELPQLFNILKGDMSIVGPRPRLVKDMIFYDKDAYDHYVVTPGLTGPTQAFGRNKNTWEQVFEKDIEYSQNITFLYDLKIFIFTFVSVFKNKGETHTNAEEDKHQESKEQEYYYADYLLRTGKITKEQYDLGMKIADEIVKNLSHIDYYPQLHNTKSDSESEDNSQTIADETNKQENTSQSAVDETNNQNKRNFNLQDNEIDNPAKLQTNENDKKDDSLSTTKDNETISEENNSSILLNNDADN